MNKTSTYFLRADTQAFHQTLKKALRRRGLPAKLYPDQDGPFTNDHTRILYTSANPSEDLPASIASGDLFLPRTVWRSAYVL
jgi:hypothetical protein